MTVKTIEDWKQHAEEWEQLAYRYQAEIDALVAHVELLRAIADKLRTVTPENLERLASNAAFVLRETPTTSLSRMKAKWQAEALEEAAEDSGDSLTKKWLSERALMRCRQVEEGR